MKDGGCDLPMTQRVRSTTGKIRTHYANKGREMTAVYHTEVYDLGDEYINVDLDFSVFFPKSSTLKMDEDLSWPRRQGGHVQVRKRDIDGVRETWYIQVDSMFITGDVLRDFLWSTALIDDFFLSKYQAICHYPCSRDRWRIMLGEKSGCNDQQMELRLVAYKMQAYWAKIDLILFRVL